MSTTIKLESGHFSGAEEIVLTCEHAASSYGMPVAVLVGGVSSGKAFGPLDIIPSSDPNDLLAGFWEYAQQTVAHAAKDIPLNADIEKFCRL